MATVSATRQYVAECDHCHAQSFSALSKEGAKATAILEEDFVFLTYPDGTEIVLCADCADTMRPEDGSW